MAGRKIENPFKTGKVLVQENNKDEVSIPFIPHMGNLVLSFLSSIFVPKKDKKSAVKKGDDKLEDPSDDSAKYQQVAKAAEARSKEIQELESKIDSTGGNRYTIIQGCDVLEVGLGMNNIPSYRVDKDKGLRTEKIDVATDTTPDSPPLPVQGKANHVQGTNPPASPGGHYMIKCSNKFTVVAGSQGIDLNTTGPLNISAGIIKFTGAELGIGTTTGRTLIEGETVSLNGKSVELSPTEGQVVVRGTLGCTGNLVASGHTHSESISFVNAVCPGKNETSKTSSPPNMQSGPAFWGGVGIEGIIATFADMSAGVAAKVAIPATTNEILGVKFLQDISKKMMRASHMAIPWEQKPTGFIIPGTSVVMVGSVPCNYGGIAFGMINAVVTVPVLLNNFPHTHSMHDGGHVHETRVPAIDYSANTTDEIRSKVAGASTAAPFLIKNDQSKKIFKALYAGVTGAFAFILSLGQTATTKTG